MSELLNAVISWKTLVVALILFGFAPGLVLRLALCMYPRNDPRRREMHAELFAVPRWERPFWVCEQLELAFAEGLIGRSTMWWMYHRGYYTGMKEAHRILRQHVHSRYVPAGGGGYIHIRTMRWVPTRRWRNVWYLSVIPTNLVLLVRTLRARDTEG